MRKILIVDDEAESTDVIKTYLDASKYEVLGITNPFDTVKTILEFLPDLLILDWIMPLKDGIDVLKEIKSIPETREIPVIISTGLRTNSDDLRSALEAGAADFLRKPVDEIELQARIESILKTVDLHRKSLKMKQLIHDKEKELLESRYSFLQNELTKREKEMIVAAVEIFQSKKMLTALRSEIFAEEIDSCEDFKSHLTKILDRYDNESNCFNWQLFEKRFIEVNNDFYSRLKQDFPNITTGELRICALQKIGMSIKEISILNYSNYEAVRKAVYRIRKKMDLDENTNLSIFLQGY
ncbi:MAG: response regulator [Bacteroidales bacterium]|nr:response regulator [Bacteroidales bacterium]